MKRRTLVRAALALAVAAIAVPAAVLAPYALRVRHVAADPAHGFRADFYLYVPPAVRAAARAAPAAILVQPNNSGITTDDDAKQRRDAWWMGFGRKPLADRLGVVLLVPAFPRRATDWRVYTHALDRDVLTTDRPDLARLDLQLVAMIDRARADLAAAGVPTRDRVLLQGFSASGMFANRFTALHPARVLAVAAGSPGGWPIAPVAAYAGEPLPYPAGIADLDSLAGAPFDTAAYRRVPQLVVMGDRDDNDGLDFEDGWDRDAAARVERLFGRTPVERWSRAESLYRAAGADARFVLVAGVGHDRRRLQDRSTRFIEDVLRR